MPSRLYEDFRHNKHWTRALLRKSRRILIVTVAVVAVALYSAFRYVSRSGYFDARRLQPQNFLWAYSHINATDTVWPPRDPIYLLFEPPPPSFANKSLQLTRRLPSHCIDLFFATGEVCSLGPDPPLDVVWTWVNGSDNLLRESMSEVAQKANNEPKSTSRSDTQFFRDHDELRHSIRSVLKHFRRHTNHMHIVTSDFPIHIPVLLGDKVFNNTRRLGLAPRWLDVRQAGRWKDHDIKLALKYHSEMFYAYNGSSFNSYAIESQFVNLRGVSETFIYMNDDFYMMADLSASDFYTSAYGPVLRMQSDLLVKNTDNPRAPVGGEWGPLEYTNSLLSKRFGSRRRPYTTHAAKSLSMPLMREFSIMWQPELTVTASHPFRGMIDGHRDIYSIFLNSHFIVERWREGLLWSWAVGKLGDLDGKWGPSENERAWRDLGGQVGEHLLDVLLTRRTTMDDTVVREHLRAAGHQMSGKTRYEFASGDGFPYEYRDSKGTLSWPSFMSSGRPICTLDYFECFSQEFSGASDFFKNIAFDKNRRCGDCVIHALRAVSGTSGISAFLPDDGRSYTTAQKDPDRVSGGHVLVEEPPHLPLVSEWRNGDFSLRGVLPTQGEVNIRQWTLRMLERYRFVIGQTPTLFHQITSVTAARIKLQKVDEADDVALLCLNDDIKGLSRKTDKLLLAWQERKWGDRAKWEL